MQRVHLLLRFDSQEYDPRTLNAIIGWGAAMESTGVSEKPTFI